MPIFTSSSTHAAIKPRYNDGKEDTGIVSQNTNSMATIPLTEEY